MKSEMCAAWLPEFVNSVGGQGVHPIRGELGVVEKVRLKAKAALVCETQGCKLHPETGEMGNRKRRKRSDTGAYKVLRETESGRTCGLERNRQRTGDSAKEQVT